MSDESFPFRFPFPFRSDERGTARERGTGNAERRWISFPHALSLKTKQVAGVTLFVGLVVVLLSAWYVSSLATVWLGETQKRADMLVQAIFQSAFTALQSDPADPVAGLQNDAGLAIDSRSQPHVSRRAVRRHRRHGGDRHHRGAGARGSAR